MATGFGIADGVVDPSGRKALGGHHAELRQPAVVDGLRGFDEPAVDNTPHEGHAAAVGSAVTACTTRVPSARRSTCSTRHAWQPEKQCRTFGHDPLVPVFRLKFQTSDFGRPRACSCSDTPYESETTTARLELKNPGYQVWNTVVFQCIWSRVDIITTKG